MKNWPMGDANGTAVRLGVIVRHARRTFANRADRFASCESRVIDCPRIAGTSKDERMKSLAMRRRRELLEELVMKRRNSPGVTPRALFARLSNRRCHVFSRLDCVEVPRRRGGNEASSFMRFPLTAYDRLEPRLNKTSFSIPKSLRRSLLSHSKR